MIRLVLILLALPACAQEKAPERPTKESNERLDSIEARLDAAEAADPTPPVEAEEDEDQSAP